MALLHRVYYAMVERVLTGIFGLIVLLPLVASCNAPEPLQFIPLNLGIPAEALISPTVGPLPGNTKLHVRITFKIDQNVLKQAEQREIEPGKRSHLEDFANKIGIDDGTYQKVKEFFRVQDIALKLSKLRTYLSVDAKASTFAKLFQTTFVIHKYHDRIFYAPATPPKVPQFLANSIDAITGLDNFSILPQHDFSMYFKAHQMLRHQMQDCSPDAQTLLPREVADAYGYDKLWNRGWHGENMTVNLVEIDGFYQEDVQNYFDCIQFKGNLSVVNVDGAPGDALGESTLDIQMIAGLARSINIISYQTDGSTNGDIWTQVNDELQQIIDDNVNNANSGNVVSMSLGTAERELTSENLKALDSSFQQLTRLLHMSVFVASGDCGAFGSRVYGKLAVSFPASDPWTTSVGGTILQVDGNSNRINEVAWSDDSNRSSCKNRWGTGGGNSEMFNRPSWQNGPGVNNQFSRGVRQVPDVSAVAYALAVYFNGQWGVVGGTSAAAPIWATGIALVNQGLIQEIRKFGYSPQIFYLAGNRNSGGHPYYDVTQGNNLYYPATSGWDYSTGLGTPNLADFYQAMSKAIV